MSSENKPQVFAPGTRESVGQHFVIQDPVDLVREGITVSDQFVRETWGEEGLANYRNAMLAKQIEEIASEEVMSHQDWANNLNV
ncbi:hypothetical protein HY382_02695 [Candidatus Curtissbacteria bacterium]|nr:hypothetical protein [Candidatus Curtissbacteria bacterium]